MAYVALRDFQVAKRTLVDGDESVVVYTEGQDDITAVELHPFVNWLLWHGDIGAAVVPALYADNETPSGSVDGSNPTFTLAHAPDPTGSLELYVNGVLQTVGWNYTLAGSTITFDSSWIPATSDRIRAWYRYTV